MDRPTRDEENTERPRVTADDRAQPARRPRKKAVERDEEFNPSSTGDEQGEVM